MTSLHQGGIFMSSLITHTQTSTYTHSLAHILDICALIFNSCDLCTVYLTPLQVITTRAREGGPKEQRSEWSEWQRETHLITYVPELSTLSDL